MPSSYYGYTFYTDRDLAHHGVRGQKWGIRRYQNKDGSLTNAGQKRYSKLQDVLGYDERDAMNKAKRNEAYAYAVMDKTSGDVSDSLRKWNKAREKRTLAERAHGKVVDQHYKAQQDYRSASEKYNRELSYKNNRGSKALNEKRISEALNAQTRAAYTVDSTTDALNNSYNELQDIWDADAKAEEEYRALFDLNMSAIETYSQLNKEAKIAEQKYSKTPLAKIEKAKGVIVKAKNAIAKIFKKK